MSTFIPTTIQLFVFCNIRPSRLAHLLEELRPSIFRHLRPAVHASSLLLDTAHRLPERLQALGQHVLLRLQESTLLRDLRWLRGHEFDLFLRHVGHGQGREDRLWEWVDEVALDDLLGNGVDEVLEFILSYSSVGAMMHKGGGGCLVVSSRGVQSFLAREDIHVYLDGGAHVSLKFYRVDTEIWWKVGIGCAGNRIL